MLVSYILLISGEKLLDQNTVAMATSKTYDAKVSQNFLFQEMSPILVVIMWTSRKFSMVEFSETFFFPHPHPSYPLCLPQYSNLSYNFTFLHYFYTGSCQRADIRWWGCRQQCQWGTCKRGQELYRPQRATEHVHLVHPGPRTAQPLIIQRAARVI